MAHDRSTAAHRIASLLIVMASAALLGSGAHAIKQNPSPHLVRITAERFAFTPAEVKVPQGTTIEFHLRSEDTAHGFRILGQSIDLTIPKRGRGETTVTFTPPEPGSYVFECSRMCGAGHSFMRGTIKVTAATGEAP
jgi:cytochrome c oxidase subunit 2